MANVPQRRSEADNRSKKADKKYRDRIDDAAKVEQYAYNLYSKNPTPENEEFAMQAADELNLFESERAREGGYDRLLNPRKKGTGYFKKGGMVKKSKPKATKSRGDGIATRGKTRGRMV